MSGLTLIFLLWSAGVSAACVLLLVAMNGFEHRIIELERISAAKEKK